MHFSAHCVTCNNYMSAITRYNNKTITFDKLRRCETWDLGDVMMGNVSSADVMTRLSGVGSKTNTFYCLIIVFIE